MFFNDWPLSFFLAMIKYGIKKLELGAKLDFKVFGSTFVMIFLAEMGDKTQVAALLAAAENKSFLTVALATVLALSFAGVLGVFFGHILGSFINPKFIKTLSGLAFILIGVWTLIKS